MLSYRETDRQTETETDRQTETQTERQRHRPTDRERGERESKGLWRERD